MKYQKENGCGMALNMSLPSAQVILHDLWLALERQGHLWTHNKLSVKSILAILAYMV